MHAAFGDEFDTDRIDIVQVDDAANRGDIAASYESQLTEWELLRNPSDSIGRAWEHGTQRFTVIFLAINEEELVVTIQSLSD